MRIRRDISSIPFRSAADTWACIVALVTADGSVDIEQLKAAGGTIASVITDEIPAEHPFILEGCGAQLRIYCRYAADAIQEGGEVDALTWNPTAGDWMLHVPCDTENIGWIRKSLAKTAPRIKAFDTAEAKRAGGAEQSSSSLDGEIVVDWGAPKD
jgi:hypothetical protein